MQVVNAQAAHVALVLISNSDDTGFIRLEPDQPVSGSTPPNITTPSAAIPQNSARPLYDALASGQALTVSLTQTTLAKGNAKLHQNRYRVVQFIKLCPTLANSASLLPTILSLIIIYFVSYLLLISEW